jgi:ABC-type multidrug transport system ATPase subunit
MIRLRGITKSYRGRHVLTGLTADVRPGELTLLVGANGCGKTTLLRLVAGLSVPAAGEIAINGRRVTGDDTEGLAALSYLPQSPRFHEQLTPTDILAFYAGLRGISNSRVAVVVAHWGLSTFLRARTAQLSGGLRQRLALAVLFLPDVPVLVLDEPGLSLDPDWRQLLQSELRAAARQGRTVLVSTHLLGEWDHHADRCLVLEGGVIGRELPPDRLLEAFPFQAPRPSAVPRRQRLS